MDGGPGGGGASWAFELTDTARGTPVEFGRIVSDVNTTGGFLQTSYAWPAVTFEDIAGKTLRDNGACP